MSETFEGVSAPRLVWSQERPFVGETFDAIEPLVTGYLIKGVFPERGTGFMVGASKAGKTFVAIDWSCKIACGATVMTKKTKQVGVVYLGAEDPDGCRARIKAWKRKYPRQSYTPFTFIGRRLNLLDEDQVEQFIIACEGYARDYQDMDYRLGLVVIDTFSKCLPGGDENSSGDGSRALDALQRISEALNCFVLALAHHGKSGKDGGIRGWSGFDAGSDATVTVERDLEQPDHRQVTLSKVKNGPDGQTIAFSLERQNLGVIDSDGEDMWSCVVTYESLAADQAKTAKKRKALSAEAEMVLVSLGKLLDKSYGQPIPASIMGVRPGTQGVRRADLSLEAKVAGLGFDGEKPNTYNQRFGRRIVELLGAKRIRQEGDLIWLI